MADLPEADEFTAGIYQIETTDPVEGGADGINNRAAKGLANRTLWAKNRLPVLPDGTGYGVSDVPADDATKLATAKAVHSVQDLLAGYVTPDAGDVRYLRRNDVDYRSYNAADAPEAFLVGANLRGDTAITIKEMSGGCLRIGPMAFVTLKFMLESFSIPAASDDSLSANIDLEALAATAGWFSSITNVHIGWARGRFLRSSWDAPLMQFHLSGAAATGLIFFENDDTQEIPAQSGNANQLEMFMGVNMIVED